MIDFKVCNECGGKMFPTIIEKSIYFDMTNITLKDLHAWVCPTCGETVFSQKEAKRIESLLSDTGTK